MSTLPRHPQFFRDVSDRPVLIENTLNQQQPSANIQTGISVRQENLLAVDDLDISTKPGGSPFSQDPKCHQRPHRVQLTAREIGAAFSLVLTATEPDTEVYGFTGTGKQGFRESTTFSPLNISRKQRLDDVMRKTGGIPFGGTDCALPMIVAREKKWEIDTFVVITDNETWAGAVHPHQALQQYRDASGIDAKLIVLAVTPTKFTIADPTDLGMLDIAGFGTDVPTLVTEFSRGL